MNSPKNQMDHLLARAGLYQFYARLIERELDIETLSTFNTDPLKSAFHNLKIEVPDLSDETVETLAIDFCHIFIGPRDFVPPYQSVWESGQFESAATDSMAEYLEIITPQSKYRFKDHAGLQLEMMNFILQRQHEIQDCSDLANVFFARHVEWIGGMLHAAAKRSETPFYQSVLTAGAEFLRDEQLEFTGAST